MLPPLSGGLAGGQRTWGIAMVRKSIAGALHRLTVRQVMAAGEGDNGDGGGLLLRVRGVTASWVYRFTAPSGRRREMGLGVARRQSPAVAGESLMGARKLANEARELVRMGVDPIDTRESQRKAAHVAAQAIAAEAKRKSLTLARATRDYHERVIEPRLSAKHAAQWITSLENHMPADIWHAPVAHIQAPDLLAALSSVRSLEVKGERVPETLRRIRQRLDAVFEDAIFHGYCTSNPAAAIRRKMREQLPAREAGSFRALDYRDAPALMGRIRAAPGVSARALELALLTAARTGEVLGATWQEFDLQAGVWIIPKERTKGRREPHLVPLSSAARELIAGLVGLHSTYLFPSIMKPGRPMSNMSLLAMLGRLGMRDHTTVHGLCRATFSTWAYETAAARPEVIEACLAHREADRVKAAYNRAQFYEERRLLIEAWAAHLNAAQKRAMILPIRAA